MFGILANGKVVIRDVFATEYIMHNKYCAILSNSQEIVLGDVDSFNGSESRNAEIRMYIDIYDTKIILTENEAKSITNTGELQKIGDIFLMNFENYVKHSHLKYYKKLSMLDHKNNEYLKENDFSVQTKIKNVNYDGFNFNEINFTEFDHPDLLFSLKNLYEEKYLSNVRTLMIRGDFVQIPEYVIKKIPYIQEKMQVEKNHIINIDEIPPGFMKLLVTFINNDLSPLYMSKIFHKIYDSNTIIHHLQCIKMLDLIKQMNLVS